MAKNQVQQRNLEKRKRQEEKLQKKEKELKKVAKETKNLKSNHKKGSPFLDLFKKEKKRYTIEDTIPYKKMYRNGICYVGEGKYNKLIKYEDINYQLALEEDRDLIFNQFAGFLNSFDSTTELQLSFVNQVGRIKEMENAITIPDKGDDFDEIREEFREMLKDQLSKGNNGLKKSKYVVVSTRADTYEQAKPVLERIEIDVLSNLKSMEVRAETLIGIERLKLLHDMLNPDKVFDYDGQGLEDRDTRKLIMPSTFKFTSPKHMQMGNYICALSHFQILASELSDRFLSEILSIEDNMYVSFHIHAIDQVDAIKMIKRKNTDLQKMMIEEQKKAVRAGYDMDIIPSDLNVYGNEIKNLLTDLHGYKKNKKQKNHLIVDRNVSHMIRKIFEMKIEGYSSKIIADELNKLGIQTPGTYKESQGSNYSTGFASNKNKWQAKMINRIIENRVYIGVLEQGNRTKLNYKSNKEIKVLEEDWIKVEGTHEAIVTETMFNVANKMMGRDILNRKLKPDFLTGLLYCADCGNQLIRRRQKTKDGYKIYYICGLYNRGNGCSRHSIREEEILSSLDFILRQHIKYQEELFTRIRETDLSKTKYQLDLDDLIADRKKYETLVIVN